MLLPQWPESYLQEALQQAALRCTELLPLCCRAPAAEPERAELQALLARIKALGSYGAAAGVTPERAVVPDRLYRGLSLVEPALRERLLVHVFRGLQALALPPVEALLAVLQGRIQGLLCRLYTPGPETSAELAVLLSQVKVLGTLPVLAAVDLPRPREASIPDHCTTLLRWQQWLEQWQWRQRCPSLPPPLAALRHCLQRELAAVAQQCRQSDWTLAFFCGSGLQQVLERLHLAARDAAAAVCWCRHAGELLDMHLDGCAPDPARLAHWLEGLYRWLEQGVVPAMASDAAVSWTPVPEETVVELAQWRHALLRVLQQHAARQEGAAEDLQRLLYKPGWVLAALGRPVEARLFRAAWQIVAQYRHLGLQEPPALPVLLRELAGLLDTATQVPAATLQRWQSQVLRLWPGGLRDGALGIPLALPDAADPHLVALAAVPDLLSMSFGTLTQVEQCWFEPAALLPQRRAALAAELDLLEKGAAALKVWPLEELCTLLLELYARGETDRSEVPGALLWQAHRQLLRMLDEAAAWQEPQRDEALLAQLRHWLGGTAERAAQVCEPQPQGLPWLQQRLRAWLSTLAAVVERPVRLQVGGATLALSPPLWLQLEAGLKPLLKFLLLDNAADIPSRRALHRPRTSTFVIRFGVCAGGIAVEVDEDSRAPALDQARLQRLQRTLPAGAGPLECELVPGCGRRLRFTMPPG